MIEADVQAFQALLKTSGNRHERVLVQMVRMAYFSRLLVFSVQKHKFLFLS